MPCFALLACAAFALPIKLSLSQPTSFLTFTFLILSPIPLGQSPILCPHFITTREGWGWAVRWDVAQEKVFSIPPALLCRFLGWGCFPPQRVATPESTGSPSALFSFHPTEPKSRAARSLLCSQGGNFYSDRFKLLTFSLIL